MQHLVSRDISAKDALADHEGQLDLELRIAKVSSGRGGTGIYQQEQRPRVGLIDVHAALHRPEGEPYLVPNESGAVRDLEIDPSSLTVVGIVERQCRGIAR